MLVFRYVDTDCGARADPGGFAGHSLCLPLLCRARIELPALMSCELLRIVTQ